VPGTEFDNYERRVHNLARPESPHLVPSRHLREFDSHAPDYCAAVSHGPQAVYACG